MLHCIQAGPPGSAAIMGGDMRAGQRVRMKELPQFVKALRLEEPASGTVLCSYSAGRRSDARELIDVRLDSQITLWGVAASAFEDAQQASPRKS